jgi:hypothetical protein
MSACFRRALVAMAAVLVTGALAGPVGAAEETKEKKVLEIGRWYPSLEAGITFAQSAYSDNWKGGDLGQVVWTFILNSQLENQLRKQVNWLSTLKLAYGQTHQQARNSGGEPEWDRPNKSTDLIDLETTFRFTLGSWVDPFVSGRFVSQFQDQSDPFGRDLFVNPMTVTESAGIAREFYRTEDAVLLSRLGLAARQNIRTMYEEAPPVDDTETDVNNDAGKVTWTSKLTVFQPLVYSFKSEFEDLTPEQRTAAGLDENIADYPLLVDVDWENIFTSQITGILSVNLYVQFIYDQYDNSVAPKLDETGGVTNPGEVNAAVRKAGQFKQTLAIGLVYRFL